MVPTRRGPLAVVVLAASLGPALLADLVVLAVALRLLHLARPLAVLTGSAVALAVWLLLAATVRAAMLRCGKGR